MRFKKIITTILLAFLVLGLFGCDIKFIEKEDDKNNTDDGTKTDKKIDDIYIYAVNDFHGIVYEDGDSVGLSKLFGYIKTKKDEHPDNTIILSSGDMFQGTAVSSLTRGRAVVEVMNYIGFDAMSIGNHEWDWGIDEVLKYQDGDLANGEANFPFLVANVTDVKTNKLASWAKPYTVIEKSGYKFGIIGIIGHDQKNDILASYTEDYLFTDELTAIKEYTKILRQDEKVDFVIVSSHSDTSSINSALASLTGSYKVDVILNGHTHQAYYGILENIKRNVGIPYVQSGSYGRYIGKVTLRVNNNTREIIFSDSINLATKYNCKVENRAINAMIASYSKEIAIASSEAGISALTMYQSEGGRYCANVLRHFSDAELGICNSGGIRGNAFPINKGDVITYGDVFEMSPFENKIVLTTISGSDLLRLLDYSGLFISDNVDVNLRTINGVAIESNGSYRVATIDYLYEKTNYPFKSGKDIVHSDTIFRDEIFESMKENVSKHGQFYWDIW